MMSMPPSVARKQTRFLQSQGEP
jgi:hypothetical protein